MVASGNVGLAFGLVVAAGMATTIGACIVFCADAAKPRLLAGSLGFAAGVMIYVSFAEIFLRKSVSGYVTAGYSDIEAYRYATLAFFGGFLAIAILDKVVHLVADCATRKGERLAASQSQAVLLDNEDSLNEAEPSRAPRQVGPMKSEVCGTVISGTDVEAATGHVSNMSAVVAQPGAFPICPSCVPRDAQRSRKQKKQEQAREEERQESDDVDTSPNEEAKDSAGTTSREPPAVVEIMNSDPHSFALKKMGVLTALAIFIHNFPEGLATFVGALADTSIGIGIAVAIAMHNIPEGICVAMPIYYATGSKLKGFLWAMVSGLSEPVGALVGWLVLYGDTSLSFAIVFALVAGMMVYISIKELIPTALKYDPRDSVTTTCVVVGMVVMAGSLLLFTL